MYKLYTQYHKGIINFYQTLLFGLIFLDPRSRVQEPRVRVPLEESPLERQLNSLSEDRRQVISVFIYHHIIHDCLFVLGFMQIST